MDHTYLIRYGLMAHVGRFAADCEAYERGQTVVVRSPRGLELGEVLLKADRAAEEPGSTPPRDSEPRVLRAAGVTDRDRARQLARERSSRLEVCERVFQDGLWPLQLVDVEPMLDGHRMVVHYLGPHRLDASGLVQAFRERCGFEVFLEPAGIDADEKEADEAARGCGHCGHEGGCGSGGGCGSDDSAGAGCSGCAVKELVKARR
jgi:cell fate regulator YaaT (PSP1 superfamily)